MAQCLPNLSYNFTTLRCRYHSPFFKCILCSLNYFFITVFVSSSNCTDKLTINRGEGADFFAGRPYPFASCTYSIVIRFYMQDFQKIHLYFLNAKVQINDQKSSEKTTGLVSRRFEKIFKN